MAEPVSRAVQAISVEELVRNRFVDSSLCSCLQEQTGGIIGRDGCYGVAVKTQGNAILIPALPLYLPSLRHLYDDRAMLLTVLSSKTWLHTSRTGGHLWLPEMARAGVLNANKWDAAMTRAKY